MFLFSIQSVNPGPAGSEYALPLQTVQIQITADPDLQCLSFSM